MDQDSTHMVAASKVPMLKPGEFELWRMRIEQYIQMIDYALWEVIENGNTTPKTTVVDGVEKVMPPTTVKEKARKDDRNKTDLDTMSMDDLYNNLKVYKPEVKWMSSSSISTQNMVFVSSSNNNNSSTNGAVSTTQAVNNANGVSAANTQVNASNVDNLSDAVICAFLLVNQIILNLHMRTGTQIPIQDDLEEMDLRWQMAMLTMRARRFLKNTSRKLTINGNEFVDFDKSKVECYNSHKNGHFAKECKSSRNQDSQEQRNAHDSYCTCGNIHFHSFMSCGCPWWVDCNYHYVQFQKHRMVKPIWNNAQRVNHQNFAKKTHPCVKKNMVPRAVLMKSSLVSVNTARQINTVHSKITVNAARPMPKALVNAARPKAVVNAVKGNNINAVKASACWCNPQMDLQDQGVIDSGCSRHMTGNMSYLTNYEEIDRGYVTFGGNPKGGKITGKSTIKTGLKSRKETEPVKKLILLPLWPANPPYSQDPKSSQDHGSKPSTDDGKKVDEDSRKDSEGIDQEKEDNVNSTNNVNAAGACTNLDTTIQVSPISTTRINKDHPLDQVIGDFQSATQTKRMSNNLEEHGFVCTIQEEQTIKDFKTACLLAFYHWKNPKRAIGTKWVFRNKKKDEKGIVIRNKARLVAQGYTQEEGIDYDGRIFHLHQKKDGIFISQDKYVDEILKKFEFTEVKTTSTLIETQKPLLKDENSKEVDVHMYRSMIGSLMYLTSSRPDIMFAVCACARYQVNPKVSHLHDVNMIFRLVPSCFVIFDLEPLSLSFDFVFCSKIFKSLSFRLDRLCHLAILCLDQHAHTLHHLESLLTISLDRLNIFEGRSCISEFVRKSLSLILELS
ncbi:ribonuclease H-like domain-containing protein [Tanacetum coccineum]